MGDLISGFLSVDSRLAHSIPALLFRPGFLTREFLNGRRRHFLDPVRMFIAIVAVFFLIFSLENGTVAQLNTGQESTDSTGNHTNPGRDTLIMVGDIPVKFKINDKPNSIITIENDGKNDDDLQLDVPNFERIKTLVNQEVTDTDQVLDSLGVEKTFWKRFWYGEVIKFVKSDFGDFKDYFMSKLPWIVFSIIPVFALLLKLLYLRRKMYYVDHLIFSFHLFSFIFLCGIVNISLKQLADVDIASWIMIANIIYIFFAFKNFYLQGWFKTLSKLFILFLLYSLSMVVFLTMVTVFVFIIY